MHVGIRPVKMARDINDVTSGILIGDFVNKSRETTRTKREGEGWRDRDRERGRGGGGMERLGGRDKGGEEGLRGRGREEGREREGEI